MSSILRGGVYLAHGLPTKTHRIASVVPQTWVARNDEFSRSLVGQAAHACRLARIAEFAYTFKLHHVYMYTPYSLEYRPFSLPANLRGKEYIDGEYCRWRMVP